MTESSAPPTAGPHDPPPITAYAWRTGLVRPTQGRLVAGVCGALGRATNTDPILWRVIIAVLALFGGVGVAVYLVGWMLLPADGDTASPVEALLVRGQSRTSTTLTAILSIIAVLAVGGIFVTPFRPGFFGGALIVIAVLLLLRDQRRRTPGPTATPPPGPYPAASYPPGGYPAAAYPPASAAPPVDAPYDGPAPFAPRGPFVPVGPPPVPPAPPTFPRPNRRPRREPRPRSALGGLTLSVLLLVLGVLFGLNQLGYGVAPAGYFAAALAVIGLGLLVGAWYGRARGLIALGILVTLGLSGANAAQGGVLFFAGTRTVVPATVSQLDPSYRQGLGNMVIDLSGLDFRGEDRTLSTSVDAGNLEVIVGPDVDVVIDAGVDAGNAQVFGQHWSGLGMDRRTVTDNGDDGPGGGRLHITAAVNLGNLEVHR